MAEQMTEKRSELREVAQEAIAAGCDKPGTYYGPLSAALQPIAPTVLALLDELDRLRGVVERVDHVVATAWRETTCGCGHRADLHHHDSGCLGGLALCSCMTTFSSIVTDRLRAALDGTEKGGAK